MLVRLPGFRSQDISEITLRRVKASIRYHSMTHDQAGVLVASRVLNAIWKGFDRGQDSARVNLFVDHTEKRDSQSGAELVTLEVCDKVERMVRDLGFRIYHVLEHLKNAKGEVIKSHDGRVIKDFYIMIENIQHGTSRAANKAMSLRRRIRRLNRI